MISETWHPASEPPDNHRTIMLRIAGRERKGLYEDWYGAKGYSLLYQQGAPGTAKPTHWRELTEEEK